MVDTSDNKDSQGTSQMQHSAENATKAPSPIHYLRKRAVVATGGRRQQQQKEQQQEDQLESSAKESTTSENDGDDSSPIKAEPKALKAKPERRDECQYCAKVFRLWLIAV